MNRYTTISWTTGVVGAGGFLDSNQSINSDHIDFVKLIVAPNSGGSTSRVEIFKRDTFLAVDRLYRTAEFAGSLIDRLEDDGATTAEANEGEPIPYDDEDGSQELHLRIYNNDAAPRTYTVTLKYQEPAILLNGELTIAGSMTIAGLNISSAAPILDLTDTTTSAKSLRIAVDSNFADIMEKAGALASFLRLDLTNIRLGLACTPSTMFEMSSISTPTLTINNPSTTWAAGGSNTGYVDFKGIRAPGVDNSPVIHYRIGIIQGGESAYTTRFIIRDQINSLNRIVIYGAAIGIGVDSPFGALANTSINQGSADTLGGNGDTLNWRCIESGWTAVFANSGDNGGANQFNGLCVTIADDVGSYIFKAESGGVNRFSIHGNGGVAIGPPIYGTHLLEINQTAETGCAVVINRNLPAAQTNGDVVVIQQLNAGDDKACLVLRNDGTGFLASLISFYYGTTLSGLISAGATSQALHFLARDLTDGSPGCGFTAARNTNTINPAAGWFNTMSRSGINGYIWQDDAGNLRIHNSRPVNAATDVAGTVVGTQTSVREAKEDIRPFDGFAAAVERVLETPLHLYRFRQEVAAGIDLIHHGFIADERPEWLYYDGRSVNLHQVVMDIVACLQEFNRRGLFAEA